MLIWIVTTPQGIKYVLAHNADNAKHEVARYYGIHPLLCCVEPTTDARGLPARNELERESGRRNGE